jgi:putative transposase
MLKEKDVSRQLPSQTAQQILKMVDMNWKSFFRSSKHHKKHPERYLGAPKPPRYKRKDGECMVIFTNQQCRIRGDFLCFPKRSQLPSIKTRIKNQFHHVRIIPKGLYYILEIVYHKEVNDLKLDKKRVLGIDLGLNNIITMVNNAGFQPAIIKGGMVKSINQFYNKKLAIYRSIKDKQRIETETKHLIKLTKKRNNKINDIFHRISRIIIDYCIEFNIGTIVVGYNKTWKQKLRIGKRNNQTFVQIPFFKLVSQINYKSKLIGIKVILVSESYTSKCSFLDFEPIEKHDNYLGKRISRGLFRSERGVVINADVNAAYNILIKAVPDAFSVDGIEGVGLHPYSITIN